MSNQTNFEQFEKNIGYTFKNKDLLTNALRHTSYTNEHKLDKTESNERLEFLGDAIVDMIVSEYLYEKFPDKPEGLLTKIRAAVVCEGSFSKIAASMSYGEYIQLGHGEEMGGGRSRASVLADAFEAVVAAMYLDGGFEQTKKWVIDHLEAEIDNADDGRAAKDYKTALQEMVQHKDCGKVSYEVIEEKGPEHAKIFVARVCIDGEPVATGSGSSKKDAQQAAAGAAIKKLKK